MKKLIKTTFYLLIVICLVYVEVILFCKHNYTYINTNKFYTKLFKKKQLIYIDNNIKSELKINSISNNRDFNILFDNVFAVQKEVFVYSVVNKNGIYEREWIKQDIEFYKSFEYFVETINVNGYNVKLNKDLLEKQLKIKDIYELTGKNNFVYREEIEIKEEKNKIIKSDDELDNFVSSVSVRKEYYDNKFIVVNGYLFNGYDIEEPNVGDIKIVYKTVDSPLNIKMLGNIVDDNIVPIKIDNNICIKLNSDNDILEEIKITDLKYLFFMFFITNFVIYSILEIFRCKFKNILLNMSEFGEYVFFSKNSFLFSFLLSGLILSFPMMFYYVNYSIIGMLFFSIAVFLTVKIDCNRF